MLSYAIYLYVYVLSSHGFPSTPFPLRYRSQGGKALLDNCYAKAEAFFCLPEVMLFDL